MAAEIDFSLEEDDEWKCDERGVPILYTDASSGSRTIEDKEYVNLSVKASKEKKISRMDLNTSKAGMEGLDREKINEIILEASKGSRFYENERKKEKQVEKRIKEMRTKLAVLTAEQKFKARQEMDKIVDELENGRDLSRTIVHVDMDAFYAAVEMRDDPTLKSKPMAVGGTAMLCTSNYLARRYGVRAGMPGFIAKKLCPQLQIVPTNFEKYRKISKEIGEIMGHYDPNYLPTSLDEAYLDVTDFLITREQLGGALKPDASVRNNEIEGHQFGEEVEEVVNEMRRKIEEKTQLTASAGIAPNMFLAKVCSDKNKPNGQFYLKPERQSILAFVRELPLRKAFGIGRVSEQILKSVLNINTCAELYHKRDLMHLLFTPTACRSYLEISLGLGSTVVQVNRERKSISTETTFREINKPEEHFSKCYDLCGDLSSSLNKKGLMARKVGVKLKTVDFEVKTRICSPSNPVQDTDEIFRYAKKLVSTEIKACLPQPLRLRLMGVRAAELCQVNETVRECKQLTITSLLKQSQRTIPCSEITNPVHPSEVDAVDSLTGLIDCEETRSFSISNVEPLLNCQAGMVENERTLLNAATSSCQEQECDGNTEYGAQTNVNREVDQSERKSFVCPVCGRYLLFNSNNPLLEFNRHVDTCLSRQAITDLLKEDSDEPSRMKHEQETSRKRKRESPDAKGKRRTLDNFLKR